MKKYLIVLTVIIFLVSCKNKYINELMKMSSFINNKEWNFSHIDNGRKIYIINQKNENIYSEIKFRVDNFKGMQDFIIEYHFTRKEVDGVFEYLHFSRFDTLCYYFENKGVRDFVFGKYYYLYEIERLESDDFDPEPEQIDYYYKYRDSLRKVHGNDLPELPMLPPGSPPEGVEEEIIEER